MTERIYDVPIVDINVSKWNVRHIGATENLGELAYSIDKLGLIQPVVLIGVLGKPPYELIVGQRRFEAHKSLKKNKIRAIFKEKTDKKTSLILSLAENMHRAEINHADAAEAVTELYKRLGKDVHKVKLATGMSVIRINRYLNIKERASAETMKILKEARLRDIDAKRALDIAEAAGDPEKANRILKKITKLVPKERKRIYEYGIEKPEAPVEEMVREGTKPRVRNRISVDLTDEVSKGLQKASKDMEMEAVDIAAMALEEWLKAQGFID